MKSNIKTILGIDTSTIACSVALCSNKELLQEFQLSPSQHNEIIIEMVDRVIKKMSLKRSDIQLIALGNGFGNSMGSRFSISVAEGLSFALGVPIIKISTMQALAQVSFWKKKIKRIIPAWDARMKNFYCGDYLLDNNYMRQTSNDLTLRSKSVNPAKKTDFLFTGNAWKVYAKYTEKFSTCYPEARSIIFLAKRLLEQHKINKYKI